MTIWPLWGLLVLALMSAPGHAAEEGSSGGGKEPSRPTETKKKETDAKADNGKHGDKPAVEEKAKATDDKGKDDKTKAEEKKEDKAKTEDKAKAEDKPKPEDKAKVKEKAKDD
ncbi:MAG TPA: hypothetical protein VJL88_01405, partial [Nitrospira sp.]|nr:hypothetical protein [Nitrospira sp.]